MPRHITPETTLDGLKKDAKRWLRALRGTGEHAHATLERLRQSHPDFPMPPTLRAVQHVIAREFGFSGWNELTAQLKRRSTTSDVHGEHTLVDRFLEHACPDHHVRGGPSHVAAMAAAMRELADHPELAHESFQTMVVCGDLAGVAAALEGDPRLATAKRPVSGAERGGPGGESDRFKRLGPKDWEPILFLAFTRLPLASVTANCVEMAQLLLDNGADPNVWFEAGGSRYTPLTGVVGEGEEGRPPHQKRDELARLFVERGANPYDDQVLYNLHFEGRVLWFLKLIYEETVKRGWAKDWEDPLWPKLGMGGYGPGSYYQLKIAIDHDDRELADWALSHGAGPNLPTAGPPHHPKFAPKETLYELAVRTGRSEIAALLLRHGAAPCDVTLSPEEQFNIAVAALDKSRAESIAAQHPAVLGTTTAIFEAARRDRADVVRLLLELGMPPDVENDQHQRALHEAAFANSLKVAEVLIEAGADVDAVGQWGGSAMGAASHGTRRDMLALLAPHSNDIWEVTFAGFVDRMRELLREKPELAQVVTKNGHTPLMWLPYEHEDQAITAARLLMSHGANPATVNSEGETAASRADAIGMHRLAAVLRGKGADGASSTSNGPRTESDYDERVQALLDAYRLGTPEALERHYAFTWHRRAWSGLRSYVQLDLGRHADDPDRDRDITIDDARWLIAREHGFADWHALVESVAKPAPNDTLAKAVELLRTPKPRRAQRLSTRDWESALEQFRSGSAIGLDAHGGATDAMLADLRDLDGIRLLRLGGSAALTDDGLRHIASMRSLRELDIGGTAITDAGLAVLRDLENLEVVSIANTRVTDAGVGHLEPCNRLASVNLMWTPTGDGALAALRGKPDLARVSSGGLVTDAGIRHLHDFPVFKTWRESDETTTLTSYDDGPNHLMLRGSFTDAGLAALVGLDGLFGLNVDDPALAISAAGLAPLRALPHLGRLAVHAVNETMRSLGDFPALKFLGVQDTIASDDGWVHLGRSRSLQRIWGRRCHGLGARGFRALSRVPTLHGLAVSCLNVPDEAVALLPEFPALRELMPIDVPDEGYRHVARCADLDRLVLMYCRETGDRATEHISALKALRYYFASYTKITDRSLELLGAMESLEEVELAALADITDAGVAKLASLPRLRRLTLSGRRVTEPKPGLFPASVEVVYGL